MLKDLNKNTLRGLLAGPLPGEKAQLSMAPGFRGNDYHLEEPDLAAVMVLLFPDPELVHTVFIKRNAYPGPHSAQVAFPGGLYEQDDATLEQTALRETREETGIDSPIDILGKMTPLYIPVSNIHVTPYVGWADDRPVFEPDPEEVQYLIKVPVEDLFRKDNKRKEIIKRHDMEFMTPYFLIHSEKIWGATAMMLSEFMALVSQKPGLQR